jgi:2-isopropylmalate synthase
MEELKGQELIHDWNVTGERPAYPSRVLITDETLRDGLQSPSITHPSIQDKVYLLYLMRDLGVDAADLGLCGAGERFKQDVVVLAREIAEQKMPIQPQSAARTLESDILPIVEASDEAGIPICACVFLGSSPIRQYAEGWELGTLLKLTHESVTLAVKHGLPVMFVTEDTTRAHPDHLRQIYSEAMRCGAERICVSDTVGHATPEGVHNLIGFIAQVRDQVNPEVGIDWHGHRDRGLDIINTLAAIQAGADRKERCGMQLFELATLHGFGDFQHGVTEVVQCLFRFGFGRFDEHGAVHDQREVNRHRVEAVINQAFGNVQRFSTPKLLLFT